MRILLSASFTFLFIHFACAQINITSAVTVDTQPNGHIDQIILTFDTPIRRDDLVGAGQFTIGAGVPYVIQSIDTENDDEFSAVVIISLQEKTDFDTGVTPIINVISGGPEIFDETEALFVYQVPFTDTEDGAAPVFISAASRDTDGNGIVDRLVVEFSETIDLPTIDNTPNFSGPSPTGNTDDFDVMMNASGFNFIDVVVRDGTENSIIEILLIESFVPNTDQIFTIAITADELLDLSDNAVAAGSHVSIDEAPPVIYDAFLDPSNAYVQVTFSEPIFHPLANNIALSDFYFSSFLISGSASPIGVFGENGAATTIEGEVLLFALEVTPNEGYYPNVNTVRVDVTPGSTTAFIDAASNGIIETSTGDLELNDLLDYPRIVSSEWVRIDDFTAYLQLNFSEPLYRGFEADLSPRLANAANGQIDDAFYENGTNSTCSSGEFCIAFNPNGGVGVITDEPFHMSWTDEGGGLLADNLDYDGSSYRLYFNNIEGAQMLGEESITISAARPLGVRGRSSGHFMPSNYSYTVQLPDEEPADFYRLTFNDEDNNGIVDEIIVELNVDTDVFDDDTIEPLDFSFANFEVPFFATGTPNDNRITLELQGLPLDGTEPFELYFDGSSVDGALDLTDGFGNILPAENPIMGAIIVDQVGPTIFSATTEDSEPDGQIDRINIQFTENVSNASIQQNDFVLSDGYTVNSIEFGTPDDDEIVLVLDPSTPDTGAQPSITVGANAIDDLVTPVPNSVNAAVEFDEVTDGSGPAIVAAETGDTDGNGFIDQLVVTFSEAIDFGTVASNDFSISDYMISSSGVTLLSSNAVIIHLDERSAPNYDTDATPNIQLQENGINDLADTPNSNDPQNFEGTVDGAAPAIVEVGYEEIDAPDGRIDAIYLRFSEEVDGSTSTLAASNLNITNPGPFEGIAFGGDLVDLITGNIDELTVPLGSNASNQLTFEPVAGELQLSTTGIFNLDDLAPAPNSYTDAEIQAQAMIVDRAGPVITELIYSSEAGFVDAWDVRFSEPIDGSESYLSQNNLVFSNVGSLEGGVAFGTDNTDRLPADTDVTPESIPMSSTPSNQLTGDIGVVISLSNDGATPFIFQDLVGNSVTAGDLGSGGLEQSQATYVDAAVPVIVSAVISDETGNGRSDLIEVVFSEVVDAGSFDTTPSAGGATDQISISDGYSIASVIPFPGESTVHINLDEVVNTDTDVTPSISIIDNTILDLNMNAVAMTMDPHVPTSDGSGPVIIGATTVDIDENGFIDAIDLVFSENIDDTSLDGFGYTDFTVDGYTIAGYTQLSGPNDSELRLELSELGSSDGDASPAVTLEAAELEDELGNSNAVTFEFDGTRDGSGPAIVAATTGDTDGNGFIDQLVVTFSESIDFGSVDVDGGDFVVSDGYTIPTGGVASVSSSSIVINLNERSAPNYDTDITPAIDLLPGRIEDLAVIPNSIGTIQSFAGAVDGSAPAVVEVGYEELGIPDGRIDAIYVRFSETLDGAISTLSAANLLFTNTGSFEGLSFGGNTDDLISGATDEVTVALGTSATNQLTYEPNAGELQLSTTGSFSLVDLAPTPNSYGVEEIQVQAAIVDRAGPVITELIYSSTGGVVDAWDVRFSEPIDGDASYLSQDNLIFTNVGSLVNVAFGNDQSDRLATGTYDLTTSPIPISDLPDNQLTGAIGVEIALSNAGGGPSFIFEDPSGNSVTELELTVPGLVQNQAAYVDAASPVITSAEISDETGNGRNDRIEVEFSEVVDAGSFDTTPSAGGATDQISISDDYSIASVIPFPGEDRVHINLDEKLLADTDVTPSISIISNTILDLSMNPVAATMAPHISVDDGSGPVIVSATTVDTEENGFIDAIDLVFSEAIDDASLDDTGHTDFMVAGYDISSYTQISGPNDNELRLELAELPSADSDATPEITVVASQLEDGLDNSNASTFVFDGTVDGSGPAIVAATTGDTDGNGFIDQLVVTFSEAINFGTVASNDFSISGYTISSSGVTLLSSNAVIIHLDERSAPNYDTDATPNIQLQENGINDLADTPNSNDPQNFEGTVDGAAPAIVEVGYEEIGAPDGRIDAIYLRFSEDVNESTSTLAANNLNITNPGPFEGIAFGGDPGDLITENTDELTVPLGSNASNQLTYEPVAGELQLSTTGSFSLVDFTSTPNSYTDAEIQAQAMIVDRAGPVITELIYSSTAGFVDEWDIRFSEPIDGEFSHLSRNNLVFSNAGSLQGSVAFGTDNTDRLPGDTDYELTPAPIPMSSTPSNQLTGDIGVVISLANPTGSDPFIFQDLAGNNVTAGDLGGLEQSQATYVDAAVPYIVAANTTDRDSNGRIDRIEIELSETIRFADLDISGDAFGLTNQFTVGDYSISSVTTANDANSNIIYLNLEEGSTPDSNDEPQFEVTQASIFDLTEENALPTSNNNAVDGAGPVIVSAVTRDTNANGTIDAVDLTFDVPILDASLNVPSFDDFLVSGMVIDTYNSDPSSIGVGASNDNLLRLVLVENGLQNTNTTPEITLQIGEVSDHEGNTIQFEDQVIVASDGAAPVFLSMPDDNGGDGTYGAIESITFSCVVSEPSSVTLDLAVLQGGQVDGQLMELIGGDANVGYTYRYTTPPASVLDDGLHVINFNLVDGEGNTRPTEALEIEIDNIIPTVTVDVQEFIEDPLNPIQVISGEFSANGDSDVASLEVEVDLNDGNGYQTANVDAATGTWSFDTDQNIGIYNIDARVTDLFGNQFTDNTGIDELQIGGVTINAPTLNNICIDGASLTLDPVVISERKVNDFKLGNGVSFSIDLPEGFFYNVSNTPSAPTSGHPELANFSFSYLGPQSLRIVFDVLAEVQIDVLEIHNIQVEAMGMTPANAFASYSQGTASIFGISPDATLANLNSVSAPSTPLLMAGSSVGEVISEVEVELGNETFTLYTDGSGIGYNWYNFAGNLVHEGAEAMLSQLVDVSIPADQGNTGFDPNAAGLYSIFVGETNIEGCESSLQKVNVFVYDREVDPARFSFVENDVEGAVLSIGNDEELFEGEFLGIGLTDFNDDPVENLSSVRFVPSVTGPGTYPITFQVQNLVTNENYGFETTFIVNAEQSIFTNEVANGYCRNDEQVTLQVDISDIAKSSDPQDNFFFYGLRLLESSTLDEVGGVLIAPSGWDPDEFDSDQPVEGWGFEPVNLAEGEYIIERLIIREADIDANNLQVLNRFSFNVYENPIASISAPVTSICVDDEAFNFSADLQLGSTRSSVIIDQYIISHIPEDARAAYGEDVIISGNQFNPANPLDLAGSHPEGYPFGTYAVSYLSDSEDNENGCTDLSDAIELTVLPKPQPAYPQGDGQGGDVIAGHGMRNGNEYLLEYCTGEEIGEFSFSVNENEAISVFSNPSLTNEIEIDGGNIPGEFVITAAELIGSNQAIGGIDEDFYVVFQTNTDLNGGCPSDAVVIRLVVRDIPENPQLDLSGSEAGSQVDENTYEFNYCTSDELFASSLEPLLFQGEANAESYFNVYTAGTSEPILEEVQDLEFILSSEAFNFLQLTPGSSNLLQFERIDFDNSVLSNPPQEGQEFVGCTSSRTDVWINVFENSETPSVAAFSDSPNEVEGVITYYLCQGEEIDFSINPPDGVNDYLYEWFEGVDDTNPISLQDLQGDRVRTQDLVDEDFGFDPSIPGTYAMSVRINTNVRLDANFSGCASSLKRVDIVVNESAESPLIEVSEANVGELTGGFSYAFDFCVEGSLGLPGQTQFAANLADETKIGEVQWFTANEDGTEIQGLNPVAFGSIVSATNLGIANSLSDEFEFAVINIVNSVNSNDFFEGFEGCISEPVFVKVRVNTLPEPNFAIQGETEGRGTTFDFVDNALDQESSVTLALDASTVFEEVLQVNLSSEDFSYNFSNSGVILANLRIESMAGCAAEIAKDFRILDHVVGGAQYINDFEEPSNDPWFAEYRSDDGFEGSVSEPVRLSTWRLDEVNGTGEISQSWDEGILAWTTLGSDNLGYVGGERSFVYSPSYDISSIQNPAVRFRSIRDLDQRDGVVFQYSVDDGAIWVTLGDYVPTNDPPSSGQEWYTESGITSVPGNVSVGNGSGFNPERVGWSSQYTFDERQRLEPSNGWASSVHSLTSISSDDLRNIRFRFALGSSGVLLDEKTGDGFGFDDFEFISQSKVLLVEQFSSTLSEDSKIAEQAIPGVVDTDQVMVINYMTDLANNTSQSDQLNKRNSMDPGARSAYYGISGVPQSVLNGELFDRPDGQSQLSWNANDVDLKVLDDAQYNIGNVTATLDQSGGVISVSADFSSFFDAAQGDVSFYFAVVEKEISGVESGLYQPGEVIQNVLRVLLPGPSGFNYVGPIASGEVFSYSVDWIVDNVYDPEQLRVVIFVQNNESKEVLQTAFIDIEGALETVLSTAADRQFSVYPNPADEWVTMRLPKPVDHGHMVLFDQSGKKLLEQPSVSGQSEPSLDVSSIQDGIYYLSFYENANSVKVSKVIISH